MTERELMDALCDLRPEWDALRAEIHEERIYYVHGGRLAHELAEAVLGGGSEPWIGATFSLIERAFEVGTPETTNLVVVGLFEAMQNLAYSHAAPGDVVERHLGPRSRRAWGDLIEGWTGTGIRTIAAWRARGG